MAKYIYDNITVETAETARDILLYKLQELTNGNAQEVLELAAAYAELESVLEKSKELHG